MSGPVPGAQASGSPPSRPTDGDDAQTGESFKDAAGVLRNGPPPAEGGGLSSYEAARRLRRHGRNVVAEEAAPAALRLLARQFASPLVLILVVGALVSAALREWLDASIILAIVAGSAALGFWQEYRASTAVARLRRRLALSSVVLRDGEPRRVAASEIVPGDVVLLSAGNLVPADGRLAAATDFLLSEASLTGESFPVERASGDAVFAGTSVRSGMARLVVQKTGRATAYGAISARLVDAAPETDFGRGVRQFGELLVRVMLIVVLAVVLANQLLGRPALESLLFAVALAVGLTPELLPAIVSLTLARGARDMAKRGVIVRRLEAIEDLGSMAVLCTDKTGTLTEGRVDLHAALDAQAQPSPEVLRLAYVNAAFETGIENPLDAAIVAAGRQARIDASGFAKVDEIPYDFQRKRLTVVVAPAATPDEHLLISKGAFDTVLPACELDEAQRARVRAWYGEQSAQGYRVLALAVRRLPAGGRYTREDEAHLELRGFLVFVDPPKADARATVAALAALGVHVKIITGDNVKVAQHVAAAVGLEGARALTGREIAGMKDEALWHHAERAAVFAEVDPQQKERIVRALQRRGHAVGYMGDGINDAPALHAADVGISVESAVDVARETADVVLLAHDLRVLKRGVEDGRRIFANTLKYIAITTSANFGNMVSMAIATPLLPFLPLAAKQILLNNFLSDFPSLAISSDRVEAASVARPLAWDIGEVRRFMLLFGLVSSAFDLFTFWLLLHVFAADEALFQTAWFVVSLLTELGVVLVLRAPGPAWRSLPSPLLLWSTLIVAAIALLLPYLGPVARAFGFVPLGWPLIAAALAIVAAYLLCTEAVKMRKYWFGRKSGSSART
ncbi:MAG TPA: magnesium-translocating P-type ATPase [Burkholderiales bacterium]